jgi:hypothetical protein
MMLWNIGGYPQNLMIEGTLSRFQIIESFWWMESMIRPRHKGLDPSVYMIFDFFKIMVHMESFKTR